MTTVLVLVSAVVCAGLGRPAWSHTFRSPFHPEQCELAIDFANRSLGQNPGDFRARLILAEGLLCRGLRGDTGALDLAIHWLRGLNAEDPDDPFVRLDLADALRKRFPLSQDALAALQEVRAILGRTDVGAARREIDEYLARSIAAVESDRSRALPVLEKRARQIGAGSLSPAEVSSYVALLARTGPAGLARAQQLSRRYGTGKLNVESAVIAPPLFDIADRSTRKEEGP